MRGIKKLTVYSRKVVSGKDSKLDVRAPTLRQIFSDLAPGTPGVRGESGVAGPKGTGIKEKKGTIFTTEGRVEDFGKDHIIFRGNEGRPVAINKV